MTLGAEQPAIHRGFTEYRCPGVGFVAHAARHIVRLHGAAALHRCVVLVPDLHCAGDVSRALHSAAATAVILLPRVTTLRSWAAEVTLDSPVMGNEAREMLLYRALAERGWLDRADLWSVSAELSTLFDELTRERVSMPQARSEFVTWLRAAYGEAGGSALDFEARLVHEMWSAFGRTGGGLDGEAAYVLKLARLAEAARAPLHLLAPVRLSRSEMQFVERYAKQAPVHVYRYESEGSDACTQTLAAAWPRDGQSAGTLRERASRIGTACATSAIKGRVIIAGASSPEHEAQIVDIAVRERLLAGRRRIAVVVQDRITARRARALLERAGVLVSDEAGWALSTTSAATVIARWLDTAGGDFYYQHLLDVLKSPFIFGDWSREERQRAVWRLEQKVRAENVIAGIDNFLACVQTSEDAAPRRMLITMKTAARLLERRRALPARWLTLLMESLAAIGVRAGYAGDAAGEQLWDLLEELRDELADEQLLLGLGEWRQWLARQLDNASFRDRSIDSPVVFTYLGGMALRAFDAAVIVGGDAAHLPDPDRGSFFFNQNVRAQLGLSTRADRVRDTEEALAALIAGCDDVVVTWQRVVGGEANLLSTQLERLNALHRLAYRSGLEDSALPERARIAAVHAPGGDVPVDGAAAPAPRAAAALIRSTMSASAHNSLMACPYQYYARYVLGLAEVDAVQELIEKSDYGERVHAALASFHREHPVIGGMEPARAEEVLAQHSEAAFSDAVSMNYLARAWLQRWKALIPQYVAWQRKREADGWRVTASEVTRALEMRTPAGRNLALRGRIDRADTKETGEVALIDYKTQRRARLRAKAQADGEDVQLPFYALLWNEPVASALFVGMETDGITSHELPGEPAPLVVAVRERLGRLHDALHEGAPLPAHGVDEVCQYCEMSGLCRRPHWP